MAYYYSASERAFFSTDLMTTGSMPSDKVLVDDSTYASLQAAQVAGKIIRTGAAGAPEAVSQSLKTLAGLELDVDLDVEGLTAKSLSVEGSSALSDVNAANLSTSGTLTSKGAANLSGGTTTTTLKATGTSTLAAVNATTVTASGAIKGASVTATGALSGASLQITGNSAAVGGKNIVRTVNSVAADAAGNVIVRDVYVDGDTSDPASDRGQIGDAKRLESPDLNTIITPGIYRNTGNPTNQPSNLGLSGVGVLVVSGQSGSGNRLFQTLTTVSGIAWRTSTTNGETWDDWQLVLTSNKIGNGLTLSKGTLLVNDVAISGNPSDLASSRGQLGNAQSVVNIDYNDYKKSGTWRVEGSLQENSPNGQQITGILTVVADLTQNYVMQTFMRTYLGDTMFVRTFHGSEGWQPWRRVMLDVQDENCVHKTGVETIAGSKTFTNRLYLDGDAIRRIGGTSGRIVLQNTNLVKGTNPTKTTWFDIPCVDGIDANTVNRAGAWSTCVLSDGRTQTYMRAYKWQSGSATSAEIYVGITPDGDSYTWAPNPVTSSNDNSIATTKWVNDRITANRPEAYITETFKSGTSWYRKWSDGFIEQGGYVSNVGYAQAVTVSLLTKMSTPDYTVVLGSSGGSESICRVNGAPTTSSFQIYRQYSGSGKGSGPCFWRVSGY